MNLTKRNIIVGAVHFLAIVVGWYHLRLGVSGIIVFKNYQPFAFWVFIIIGPLSTLPAAIMTIINKRIGGYWLLSNGIVSSPFLMMWTKSFDILPFLVRIIFPMIALGIAFLILSVTSKSRINPEKAL